MDDKEILSDPILSEFLGEDLEAMDDRELYDFASNQDIDITGLSRSQAVVRILERSEEMIKQMCIDEGIDPTGKRRQEMLKEIYQTLT